MMWERCRDLVEAAGTKVVMDTPVSRIRHRDGRAVSGGGRHRRRPHGVPGDGRHLLDAAVAAGAGHGPAGAPEVRRAADDLRYRDFLTVALVVPAETVPWDDNWIYIHDTAVKTMRIQNFGSWSPYLVKDGRNVLGLEYTVEEGDRSWTSTDEVLIEQGTRRSSGASG